MNIEQLEALYGPLYRFGDHKIGETIRFFDIAAGGEFTGKIMWVKAPGADYVGGRQYPVRYILEEPDPTTGFPWEVAQGDLVE